MSLVRLAFALGMGAAWAPATHAAGSEGTPEVPVRYGAGFGTGWDQVGGHGRDGYAFAEMYGHVDVRVWRAFVVGAAVSLRRDMLNHNHALERTRAGSFGLAAQFFIGVDRERFHISLGPWLYGDDRDERRFRATLLPYGALRVRVGSTERWHVRFGLVDGNAYTAQGGGTSARLLLGVPPQHRHRFAAGLYTTVGESVAGLAAVDDIAHAGPLGTALRVGGLLGSDLAHFGSRPEVTLFVGFVH